MLYLLNKEILYLSKISFLFKKKKEKIRKNVKIFTYHSPWIPCLKRIFKDTNYKIKEIDISTEFI